MGMWVKDTEEKKRKVGESEAMILYDIVGWVGSVDCKYICPLSTNSCYNT
jgi:hypothetical protein